MDDEKTPENITGGFVKKGGAGGGYQATVDKRNLTTPACAPLKTGAGKGRKTGLVLLGLRNDLIKAGDPDYAKCLKQANQYRRIRMKELAHLHGHISAGAGALLASASLALAASRYLYEKAASDGDSTLLKQASQLADSARQSELAAWEMSAKEGVLKRRHEAAASGMPWLVPDEAIEAPKRLGRKSNAERQAIERDVPDRPILEGVDSDPEVQP